MAGYVRQSAADIVTGAVILAAPLNAEFNQLQAAFNAVTGHGHSGGAGDGPKLSLTGSMSGILPIANGGTASATVGAMKIAFNLVSGVDIQAFDADLSALAANSTDGFWAHTGAGTGAARTLTAPAAGFTITNPAGIAGNPTFVLADDLAALEAMGGTGLVTRTAANTYTQRTLIAPAAGITVTDGNGVSGNPTLVLANDLAALEGMSGTGIAVHTAANTWIERTDTGTANEITVTNGNGVSGNPTFSLPTALTFTGKTVTGGTFASVALSGTFQPTANDGVPLGASGTAFSDLFLASGGVINFNAGDVTFTHSANAMTFGGASNGYLFDAAIAPTSNDGAPLGSGAVAWSDLFLASGGVINFNNGDVLVTHSANTLAFTGASTGYTFDAPVTIDTGLISSGSWTPTVTLGTNAQASTPTVNYYRRIGDTVMCWGTIALDPTAASSTTVFNLSLPIVSDLANLSDLAGTSASGQEVGRITADTVNNNAQLIYTSASTGAQTHGFTFNYVIR